LKKNAIGVFFNFESNGIKYFLPFSKDTVIKCTKRDKGQASRLQRSPPSSKQFKYNAPVTSWTGGVRPRQFDPTTND